MSATNAEGPTPSLTRLFSPRSIAIIGASDKPGRIGTWILDNITQHFDGDICPVNPRAETLRGRAVYPDVASLPEGIDMAVVAVPADAAVTVIDQLAARGVGGVTLLTSGFSEAGAEGIARQDKLDEIIRRTGIKVLGPNCIGFGNLHAGVRANFSLPADADLPQPGPVALVSQSGGFASYMVNAALRVGVRLGYFISTGNEGGIALAHAVEHLVERDEVGTVLIFAESLKDPETLIRAARRADELDKPLVLLKAASTEEAARAAMSHTASIVGSADVLDAVCRQYGIQVVNSMEELIDRGLAFQDGRRAPRGEVAIVTTSGGAGVLLTDGAASNGLAVPAPAEATVEEITQSMPQPFYGSIANPVDLTGQVTAAPDAFKKVLNSIRGDDTFDSMAVVVFKHDGAANDQVIDNYFSTEKPMFVLTTGYMDKFFAAGVPQYLDPSRLMASLGAVARHSRRPRVEAAVSVRQPAPSQLPELLASSAGRAWVLENNAKSVLAAYGVPVTAERMVLDAADAAAFATAQGSPVALKVMSYELPHKTEYGAIRLGVTAANAEVAYSDMLEEVVSRAPHAQIEGVLAQEMVPARLEMTVGMQRDPVFGPVVAIGLGGTAIEIMAASVILHVPFSLQTAVRTISELLNGRIVTAARGLDGAELEALARIAVGVGRLALDEPRIVEIDVNPVRVHDGRAVAADALIVFDQPAGQ